MHIQPQFLYSILLIGFILYRRIKRSIGFQPLRKRRLIVRITLFSILLILLLFTSAIHPISYLYDLVGIGLGVILLLFAVKHSTFEQKNEILFYRTHIWIESLILFLFLSRFLYRMIEVYNLSKIQPQMDPQTFGKDPLTLAVFFILAVYYIGYYSFILRKSKSISRVF
ncbi:sporulation protein [Heyndrickxia vini]|uniref:Sporulation protein n=1 Tax=Heyndrickxia vini TaxID=1476025 RepID=A0ABX7E019_9BACI|nr:sporulation protein [Heyndrickxia vini]QQZ09084.1 sporulation protein [Heyndrickxia vini]